MPVSNRLGQPWADIGFALDRGLSQPVDGEPRDYRHQPSLGRLYLVGVRLVPADIGLLQDVLGIVAHAQHPVGDTEQPRPVLFEYLYLFFFAKHPFPVKTNEPAVCDNSRNLRVIYME